MLTKDQTIALIQNLKFVVQYRRNDAWGGWLSMCAYDNEDVAKSYCDDCSSRPRPWIYRVVSLETGEPIHEPQPKARTDG